MSSNESTGKTLLVAFLLCIVCSVIVSTAAVILKPSQQENQALDRKRNILAAAGMLDESRTIEEQFADFTTRIVDLRTGRFTDDIDASSFDQRRSAKDPNTSDALSADDDPAKILRREHFAVVYLVEGEGGSIDRIVLPVHGYGLSNWSFGDPS